MENFVLKPANEPTLRKRSALATQLQDAMEVDEGQYSALVVSTWYLRGTLPIGLCAPGPTASYSASHP